MLFEKFMNWLLGKKSPEGTKPPYPVPKQKEDWDFPSFPPHPNKNAEARLRRWNDLAP